MDYQNLVSELHAACMKVEIEVNQFYNLVPPSLVSDVRAFHESLEWGDFSLPATPSNKETPYVIWSLKAALKAAYLSDVCFVHICDHGGEFGFFASQPNIYRRTPCGWGAQNDMLVDMLSCMEKRMRSADDIRLIFEQIPRIYSQVPGRLQSFLFSKIEGLSAETKFFFEFTTNLTKHLRRAQEDIVELQAQHHVARQLCESVHGEIKKIAEDLKATKSFAKSKVLRGLREQCEGVAKRLDSFLHPYDVWMD